MMRKDRKPAPRKRKAPDMVIVAEARLGTIEMLLWVAALTSLTSSIISGALLAVTLFH